MLLGILHANTKSGRPSACHVCKQKIAVGELHAVVIVRYGKLQEAAFKLAAAQKRAWSKRAGLKYRRLHLQDCLSKWAAFVYNSRTEARAKRKGRPTGSGQLPQMSSEERLTRRRLVRRRAATFRLLLKEEDDKRLVVLYKRVEGLNNQLSVNVLEDMARRGQANVRLLNQKIRRAQTLVKEAADG